MANLDLAKQVVALSGGNKKPPDDTEQDEFQKFGNWTGQTDVKLMAKDLLRRGLIGAEQLVMENVNIKSPDAIRKAQSDWKVSAIQEILARARKFNLRTPAEVLANKDVLLTNPMWKEGVNNWAFKNVHPNFWNIITESLLPEQWAKYDKADKSNLVKK